MKLLNKGIRWLDDSSKNHIVLDICSFIYCKLSKHIGLVRVRQMDIILHHVNVIILGLFDFRAYIIDRMGH